jgi:iron complex outermembrane receptor protein
LKHAAPAAVPPFFAIRPLALALLLAPTLPAGAQDRSAEPSSIQPSVVVTGSRISRIAAEGPSSVTVIKGEDIERRGYKNVFDALNGQTQNTGFAQGEDFGNTFTPAASALNLRGLGPNHTLTLINGRRVADYPTAYDGSVNFVNLANVPSALIDRIEILNGGASAVYGSDAIAGVVNIILKKDIPGFAMDVKAGGTQDGGGQNARLQFSGGIQADKLHGVFGLELSAREPIWSRDRPFMADSTLLGAAPTVVAGRKNAATNKYFEPGAAGCDALSGLFEGSVQRVKSGSTAFCGSGRASPAYWTTQTQNRIANVGGLLSYELTPRTELFAEALVGLSSTRNNTRGPNWTAAAANGSYFRNASTGGLEAWSRRLAPEELGGVGRFNREWRDASANVAAGVRGDLGSGGWTYEAVYNASVYRSNDERKRLLASVDSFFLGPQQGVDGDGIAIYAPNPQRLFTALTPAEADSIIGTSLERDKAWTHNLSLNVNGELARLPAGPLRAAALVEVGAQGFANVADARLGQGVFFNTKDVPEVSGTRKRYAVGGELNVPILQEVTGTLAGRYDGYRFAGRRDGKFTYNGGLEFRPTKELLVRGNYATSFRAPDMSYIYTAESKGYYAQSTDYYRCAQAGQPIASCEFAKVSPGFNYVKNGSKDLKAENGRSWGLGLVWSPSSSFDASLDFWNIRIVDLVTDLDEDKILRTEADCRTGQADAGSPTCQDAIRRVRRNPDNAVIKPGEVRDILVNPINAAQESTHGFDVTARYNWKAAGIGQFAIDAKYTKVQSFIYRQFAGDAGVNKVHTRDLSGWPDKLVATLSWTAQPWSATVTATRTGKIPDSDTGWVPATTLFNFSASHELSKHTSVTLILNNVFNTTRRDDAGGWPFYPVGYYSPHGRQGWVEFSHKFGA